MFLFARNVEGSHTKMMQLTEQIEIPVPAGQKQYGSARFSTPEEQCKSFAVVKISKRDKIIATLLSEGDKDIADIKKDKFRVPTNLEMATDIKYKCGIPIAYLTDGNTEYINVISGDYHTITFGATRSGKSRTLVIQSICLQALAGVDIVSSDPKGELYQYTFPYLQRLGYITYSLDFKTPARSTHYNFLYFIILALEKNDISKAIQCCWDFVDGLVQEATKGEPLWTNGEKALMAAGVMQVVYDNSLMGLRLQYPNHTTEQLTELYYTTHRHFQNCTNLFNYISKMASTNKPTGRLLLEDIIDVLPDSHPSKLIMAIAESAPSKMRGSFITSALTTLRLFTDPNIAAITADTDDGFLDLPIKKAIFIILPDSKKTYYALASLFVNQYYQYLADEADELGGRLPRNIEFNLDEFGNFSKMPDFDVKLTVGAGRGIHFNMYVQSKEQLVEKYGKEVASIILDNAHFWIYLKSGQETCKMIEEKLGKYTVMSSSSSTSINDSGGLSTTINSGSSSTSTQLMARSLLTSDEVAKIARPYLLVLSDDGLPSLVQSPDLHKWQFNKMLGLGNPDHNTKLRMIREQARETRPIKELVLWQFADYIKQQLINKYGDVFDQAENKAETTLEDLLQGIEENFADSF